MIGSTSMHFSKEYLIMIVAQALRSNLNTCDGDSWPEVMASEAVSCLIREGVIK